MILRLFTSGFLLHAQLSMEERQTLCNMAIEAGGKNGIIPADDVTKKYVDARNAGNRPYTVSLRPCYTLGHPRY